MKFLSENHSTPNGASNATEVFERHLELKKTRKTEVDGKKKTASERFDAQSLIIPIEEEFFALQKFQEFFSHYILTFEYYASKKK